MIVVEKITGLLKTRGLGKMVKILARVGGIKRVKYYTEIGF